MKQEIKQSRIAVTRQVVVCTLTTAFTAMPNECHAQSVPQLHFSLLLMVA